MFWLDFFEIEVAVEIAECEGAVAPLSCDLFEVEFP